MLATQVADGRAAPERRQLFATLPGKHQGSDLPVPERMVYTGSTTAISSSCLPTGDVKLIDAGCSGSEKLTYAECQEVATGTYPSGWFPDKHGMSPNRERPFSVAEAWLPHGCQWFAMQHYPTWSRIIWNTANS